MMLIVFAGLPGVGKTTLARALAAREAAVYLRVDTIEQAIRDGGWGERDIGPAGYRVACALAGDNLSGGRAVVADCVNPLTVTREAWRAVAAHAASPLLEIEVICSDPAEHRRRVETRVGDIAGLRPPDWAAVEARLYEPWDRPRLIIDTATLDPQTALTRIAAQMRKTRGA